MDGYRGMDGHKRKDTQAIRWSKIPRTWEQYCASVLVLAIAENIGAVRETGNNGQFI